MQHITSRLVLILAVIFMATSFASAQEEQEQIPGLMNPTYQFSKKKVSYITLTDGTEITGNVKDFDRKKGIIKYIKIKDTNGKTHKLNSSEIKHGYFQPTALSKMNSFFDDLKIQHWGKDLNEEMFSNGYVYLENTPVMIKKKKMNLLMQLLNPHFSDGVRIYFDPFAKRTASIGVGPASIGGDAKSYYVKKNGGGAAIRLKKKEYKSEFPAYFGDCEQVKTSKKTKWGDLAEHAYIYARECANE